MAYRTNDWAQQRPQRPYEDYGWEQGESVLPQFRDPSVHQMPYDRQAGEDYTSQINWRISGLHQGRGPRNYQRSSERLWEEVCERLTYHGHLDASNIEVEVTQDEVTLRGTVPDRQSKRLAEDLAVSVRGVWDVHNRLTYPSGATTAQATQRRQSQESGLPGGGQGRVDQVGGSGVYPASAEDAPGDAEAQGMASWGQGDRGAAGYEDSGSSEIWYTEEERKGSPQTEE